MRQMNNETLTEYNNNFKNNPEKLAKVINQNIELELKAAELNLVKHQKYKMIDVTNTEIEVINPLMKTYQDSLKLKDLVNSISSNSNKEINRTLLCIFQHSFVSK